MTKNIQELIVFLFMAALVIAGLYGWTSPFCVRVC